MSEEPHSIETGYAVIEWDELGQPRSTLFNDIFFTKDGGLAETRHVFLSQNNLAERWQFPVTSSGSSHLSQQRSCFVIAETGFGSGLNFLATWQLWDSCPTAGRELHFISVEKHPLRKTDLRNALALWPELGEYAQQLLDVYPDIANTGFRHFVFASNVRLTLIIDDACQGLAELLAGEHPAQRRANFRGVDSTGVDAWFLDGFAPTKNPDMWTETLFTTIGELSHTGTTLATFTAAGMVKRGLQAVGFTVEKTTGFGRKRHSLRAVFTKATTANNEYISSTFSSTYTAPWAVIPEMLDDNKTISNNEIVVIGAGLAGCHTARALANRGWQVTVVDEKPSPGMGASGNPQGIVYGKLSKDDDGLAQFNLASLLFAQQVYRDYWDLPGLGKKCGVLQLNVNESSRQLYQQLQSVYGDNSSLLQFLNCEQTNEIAGIALDCGSLWFPESGWLNPAMLCHQLLDHASIRFAGDTVITQLEFLAANREWRLHCHNDDTLTTPRVVIATAHNACKFTQTEHLPLKAIRGQISIAHSPLVGNLRTVICGDGYLAPADENGLQTLGATFTLRNNSDAVTKEDHLQNIAKLAKVSSPLAKYLQQHNTEDLSGRVGFRCSTRDYLPVVGPTPIVDDYLRDFSLLRKNANASIAKPGSYWPGLFVNVGHGSRGLAYTPLCAELLAAQISGAPWPVGRRLAAALHPARFIIRDLIRHKR